MSVVAEISMSLDGYVAGPQPSLEEPLGKGGESLHDWAFRLAAWRRAHGLEGGEEDVDSVFVERGLASAGAYVMGRKMFSGGTGPWESDPNARGWWGDDPPFHVPVFVVTHHAREPLPMEGGTTFTFVTGFERAVEHARAAAGGRDVRIAGGAEIVRQALEHGVVDELVVHIAPRILGDGGTRLFAGDTPPGRLEVLEVVSVPLATHIRYGVAR